MSVVNTFRIYRCSHGEQIKRPKRVVNERTNGNVYPLLKDIVHVLSMKTRSSAVAKRPRDVSRLSVWYGKTKMASVVQNVEQSLFLLVIYATDLSLRTIKCCSVVFGVTLRLLVINISSFSPAINKLRRLLPAISVTTYETVVRRRRVDNTQPVAALTTRDEARYWLRIAISAYPTCIRRPR